MRLSGHRGAVAIASATIRLASFCGSAVLCSPRHLAIDFVALWRTAPRALSSKSRGTSASAIAGQAGEDSATCQNSGRQGACAGIMSFKPSWLKAQCRSFRRRLSCVAFRMVSHLPGPMRSALSSITKASGFGKRWLPSTYPYETYW